MLVTCHDAVLLNKLIQDCYDQHIDLTALANLYQQQFDSPKKMQDATGQVNELMQPLVDCVTTALKAFATQTERDVEAHKVDVQKS